MDLNQAIHTAADLANQGKFAEADKLCREMIAANDQFHPAYHLLGQLASHANRNDIALPLLERAASLDPSLAYYQRDLAEVLLFSGKADQALSAVKKAVELAPQDAKAHFILGLASMTLGLMDQAIEANQVAIELEPNFGPAHNNLGSLFERSGDLQGAKKAYTQAIKIDGKNAQAQNNLASILISEGDLDTAKTHLKAAVDAAPDYIEAHHNLSGLKKYRQNDEDLATLLNIAKDTSRLTTDNQIRLEFILGKAFSDCEDYDQAFLHYDAGNKLKRSSFDYDEQAAQQFHRKLKQNFPKSLFQNSQATESDGLIPIFIVGMPRSGSTLVEQILVSHSDVSSAGELTILNEIIKDHIPEFPDGVSAIPDNVFAEIRNDYIEVLKKSGPDSKYVIDKMPGNYRLVGLIARAMPDAKFIHTTRNPLDCCISIYTRLFLNTLHYGYDLDELGNYYNMYQNLIDHWKKVLPEDTVHTVSYEDVVGELEEASKSLTGYLGLEWQESVLEFYNQNANVKTASAAQVRKPIYKSSIERWRFYEKHLGPIKAIIKHGPSA